MLRRLLLGQESLQLAILLGEPVLVLGDVGVDLLQAKDLILEGLDVELLAFAVGAVSHSSIVSQQCIRAKASDTMQKAYRWACLFNSCLLVSAGLLSGLGPRRLGGLPSRVVRLSWSVLRKPRFSDDSGLLLSSAASAVPP